MAVGSPHGLRHRHRGAAGGGVCRAGAAAGSQSPAVCRLLLRANERGAARRPAAADGLDRPDRPSRGSRSATGAKTQLVFGIDVEGLRPGQEAVFDANVLGYPLESLADIPPGTYTVQALLHRYETFHRADGHTVKLPMDRGEGQQWNRAPGNLYSTPRKVVAIDPGAERRRSRIALDKVIPPIPDPPDDEVHQARAGSRASGSRSSGAGRCTSARTCCCPEGFDEHPTARYPLVINHGHFPYTFEGFREEPPDPNLKPDTQRALPLAGLQPDAAGARRTSSTRTGPARASRACSSSRSSTPTRTTTTPTR